MFRQRIGDTLKAGQDFGGDGLRQGAMPMVAGAVNDMKCFNCGKKSHLSSDCWEPRKDGCKGKQDKNGKSKNVKGKTKGEGKGRNKQPYFDGECNY